MIVEAQEEGERSGPMDDPQYLEFLHQQYAGYLRFLDDEQYFEPQSPDAPDSYQQHLYRQLDWSEPEAGAFCWVGMPAFQPEYLLRISPTDTGYALDYTVLDHNYWETYREGNREMMVGKTLHQAMLDTATGLHLVAVLTQTLTNARPPEANIAHLDGAGYRLTGRVAGELQTVGKQSPGPASRAGQIILLADLLIQQTIHPSDKLLASIRELLQITLPNAA